MQLSNKLLQTILHEGDQIVTAKSADQLYASVCQLNKRKNAL
jgi:hypothetical protein